MGHSRLLTLPGTRKWRQVVALLEVGAGTGDVAAATMDAAQSALEKAPNDSTVAHTLWLLTQIPQAARSDDFPGELQKIGLSVSNAPSLHEIIAAFNAAVDKKAYQGKRRTDLGEFAQSAASECLSTLIGGESRTLFGESPDSVRGALSSYATSSQFSTLARDFFGRLTRRYLMYFLSRELANHTGQGRRFLNLTEQQEFSKALSHHCHQASRIVEEFAGGWYGKTRFKGGITDRNAAGFTHVALRKIRAELRKKA